MTYQTRDIFKYNRKKYDIISRDEIDFNPENYGIKIAGFSTSCWDGYYYTLAIMDKMLVLDTLNVLYPEDPSVELFGVKCHETHDDFQYRNLKYKLDYTGYIEIGRNDKYCYDVPTTYSYEEVIMLEFYHGELIGMSDYHKKKMMEAELYEDQSLVE